MPPKLSRVIADFQNSLAESGAKSAHTISNYRRYLNHFFQHVGDLAVSELTLAKIHTYRKFLASPEAQLSTSSQNYHLTALRELLKYTNSLALTSIDPKSIKLHSLMGHQPVTALPTDLQSLAQSLPLSAEKLRDKLIIELLISTGIKVSELVDLNVTDVMPNFRQITVGLAPNSRILLLSPSTAVTLEKYLKSRQDTDPPLLIRHKTKSSDQHTRLSARTIQRTVKKLAEQSNTQHTTPQSIRNRYAIELFESGVSTAHVNQLLGHNHLESTAHYKQKLIKIKINS